MYKNLRPLCASIRMRITAWRFLIDSRIDAIESITFYNHTTLWNLYSIMNRYLKHIQRKDRRAEQQNRCLL